MKRISRLKWASLAFLEIAVGLAACAFFWITHECEAIAFAVPPRDGFSITRQFRVSSTGEYRIALRFSRSIEFERLKKLLQAGNVIEVSLLQNGEAVKMRHFQEPRFRAGVVSTDEAGNLGFAQDWISQEIAAFAGNPGKLYAITCSVLRPIEELSVTKPTLVVAVDPAGIVVRAVLSALLIGTALLLVLLAIIIGIVYYVLRRRSGMHVPSSNA